jgi:ATP/maltotriose-dependent transcriptional regulator MalT
MLLNEFLKEHRNVQDLKATVAHQQKQIEALTATVQKVGDQVALRKPAPQLVPTLKARCLTIVEGALKRPE